MTRDVTFTLLWKASCSKYVVVVCSESESEKQNFSKAFCYILLIISRKLFSGWLSFYRKFKGFFSKFVYYWLMKISWKSLGVWVKNLQGKEGKELFCKTKNSSHKNKQHLSYILPRKLPRNLFPGLLERPKWQIA